MDPAQVNSVITSAHSHGSHIKIMNFQALIDKEYTHSKQERHGAHDDSMSCDSVDNPLHRNLINLHLNRQKGRFEVFNNFIKPVFRIEKVPHPV